jgi:hypothetical protein
MWLSPPHLSLWLRDARLIVLHAQPMSASDHEVDAAQFDLDGPNGQENRSVAQCRAENFQLAELLCRSFAVPPQGNPLRSTHQTSASGPHFSGSQPSGRDRRSIHLAARCRRRRDLSTGAIAPCPVLPYQNLIVSTPAMWSRNSFMKFGQEHDGGVAHDFGRAKSGRRSLVAW